jgi:hypothetical protein
MEARSRLRSYSRTMPRLALLVAFLALAAPLAEAAATQWIPHCSSRTENTVWFVLSAKAPVEEKKDGAAAGGAVGGTTTAPAGGAGGPAVTNPDFSCVGLFFETVPCTETIVLGKITQIGEKILEPVFELRYVPSGETNAILSFLDRTGPNVLFTPKVNPAATVNTPPPTREDLFRGWLEKRRLASGATHGVTIHLWICPEGDFSPPDEEITPYGMKLVPHFGRAPT